jgi:MoaA/NifB/PqqE/SkfB family radical SAM enzyme
MRLKNLFRMGLGAALAKSANTRIPLNVMLSVTNRCTSNCVYCNIPSRLQKELTAKEIFGLIDQLADLGTQRLGLWGGEPLTRDDIGSIIDYAKNKGLYVTMDSNGYLAEEKIRDLRNLDHFILALDGPEKMHDRNRGAGSFQKAIKAIKILKDKMPVWTITVLTKDNLEGIDFVLETAKESGIQATFQVLHHNDILGKDLEALLPSRESYKAAIKKIIDKKKAGFPIVSSFNYLERVLNWQDYAKPMLSYPIDNLKCMAGRLYCNIDTDGSVYPCSLLVGKMKALNYLDSGFKKAFDSLRDIPCKACNASCFTEYNYLYSLNPGVIFGWLKAMRVSGKYSYADK